MSYEHCAGLKAALAMSCEPRGERVRLPLVGWGASYQLPASKSSDTGCGWFKPRPEGGHDSPSGPAAAVVRRPSLLDTATTRPPEPPCERLKSGSHSDATTVKEQTAWAPLATGYWPKANGQWPEAKGDKPRETGEHPRPAKGNAPRKRRGCWPWRLVLQREPQ